MSSTGNTHCEQKLHATVSAANSTNANLKLSTTEQKTCETCAKRGGCQSLSVYHWFFEKQSVEITQQKEKPYQIGEQLSIVFPDKLLQQAIWKLLGLPLVVFLMGIASTRLIGELNAFFLAIALASLAFWQMKKRLQKRLISAIHITRN